MTDAQAYLNGRFIPQRQAAIEIFDAGFVLGATVTEQFRTFGGRLFRAEDHFRRLRHSLEVVGIDPGVTDKELADIAAQLVARNHPLLTPGDDLGLAIFATPGPYRALTAQRGGPTLGMHTFPLAFELWAQKYTRGERLVITSVRQVPRECWPPELKCRSRMHYYLADREAAVTDPGARALLLDMTGRVMETSTANIAIYRSGEGLLTPPSECVLPGISLAEVRDLVEALEIPFAERSLTPEDVVAADEVWLTSTPSCLIPVTHVDGRPIGGGLPGPIYTRVMAAWNELVGFDIAAQAERFAVR